MHACPNPSTRPAACNGLRQQTKGKLYTSGRTPQSPRRPGWEAQQQGSQHARARSRGARARTRAPRRRRLARNHTLGCVAGRPLRARRTAPAPSAFKTPTTMGQDSAKTHFQTPATSCLPSARWERAARPTRVCGAGQTPRRCARQRARVPHVAKRARRGAAPTPQRTKLWRSARVHPRMHAEAMPVHGRGAKRLRTALAASCCRATRPLSTRPWRPARGRAGRSCRSPWGS